METVGSTSATKPRNVKKGVDQDDARRRRTETAIQVLQTLSRPSPHCSKVRKEKKEDQLNKRRSMVSDAASADAGVFGSMVNSSLRSANQPTVISADVIAENVRDLHSDNPALQLKATQQFRRFLSIGRLSD